MTTDEKVNKIIEIMDNLEQFVMKLLSKQAPGTAIFNTDLSDIRKKIKNLKTNINQTQSKI